MQSIYRSILKSSLRLSWKNKYLWFFGLFVALFGNGGIYNFTLRNLGNVESKALFVSDVKEAAVKIKEYNIGINPSLLLDNFNFEAVALSVVILAVIFFFIWLSVVSQGALVHGIKQNIKREEFLFEESLKKGMSRFWPVFILNIFIKVVIGLMMAVISMPFIFIFVNMGNTTIWENIFIILSFIVLVPLAGVLAFILKYAVIYAVNQDKHVGLALKEAWYLFKQNWIVSIEAAFILFAINIITSMVLVVVMIVVALPFVMLGMIAGYIASGMFLWLVVGLGILTFILFMFWYGALWNTFQNAFWVLLFEKISIGGVYSRVLRWGAYLTGGKK